MTSHQVYKRVLRYELKPFETVEVPNGQVVAVDDKNDVPNVWVEVLTTSTGEVLNKTTVFMRAFATGEVIDDTRWVHTKTLKTMPFVWHIYTRRA